MSELMILSAVFALLHIGWAAAVEARLRFLRRAAELLHERIIRLENPPTGPTGPPDWACETQGAVGDE